MGHSVHAFVPQYDICTPRYAVNEGLRPLEVTVASVAAGSGMHLHAMKLTSSSGALTCVTSMRTCADWQQSTSQANVTSELGSQSI